jgi:O-antigen ligase
MLEVAPHPRQPQSAAPQPEPPRIPLGVTYLTIYLVLLYALPSGMRITALGTLGSPALLWSLGGLLIWAASRIENRAPLTWGLGAVPSAMLVFTITVAMSYVVSLSRGPSPIEGESADTGLIRVVAWAGVLLVAHDGVRSWEGLLTLLRRFALAGGLLGLLGLAQFVTGSTLVDWLSVPGMTNDSALAVHGRGPFTRASGTAYHPLEFSLVLCMALPLALSLALLDKGRSWAVRWGVVAAMTGTISLSTSRSALIVLSVVLVLMLVGWPARLRLISAISVSICAVAVYLTVPGMGTLVLQLFTTLPVDPSTRSRVEAYDVALDMVSGAPWLGRGFGTFIPHYLILDNQFLLLMVEVGLVGTLAFLLVCLTGAVRAVRARSLVTDLLRRDIGRAMAVSIIACLVTLAFFDGLSFPMVGGTLFLVLGLAGAYARVVAR